MSKPVSSSISVTLEEKRIFPPTKKFLETGRIPKSKIDAAFGSAAADFEQYWCDAARELTWKTPFTQGLTGTAPFFEWFADGTLNASVNCLDRHLPGRSNKRAILWEGEPAVDGTPEIVDWTYGVLHHEVEKLTATLRSVGLLKGDRVAIYMPLVPESVVAMLACARAGLIHTVIFGGFSSEALKDRVNDSKVKFILTADFGYRKGAKIPLRDQVLLALAQTPSVEGFLTLKRDEVGKGQIVKADKASSLLEFTGQKVEEWNWYSLVNACVGENGSPEWVSAEHPLFILYTSGTTGKPKGLVHSTAGYLLGATRSTELVFDLQSDSKDLFWCTADIGWITGHSYLTYGPLSVGASLFMYEGAPTTPKFDRFWEMIERHKISILYTAPTAIRAFMRLGDEYPKGRDLSSLRLLGTVGEPINPEAWMWYRNVIGGENCPIVDTYWQTETGSIVVAPIPGTTPTKPGSATKPLPGYEVAVFSKDGKELGENEGGYLVIRKPWPSMARTIYGDKDRFAKTYFSEFSSDIYFTGDGARKDSDGFIWCLGRVDDVLNVSGHRLGTMEIESALVSAPKVAEAAVVGRPDEIKGQGVVAFVTLKSEFSKQLASNPSLLKEWKEELRKHVVKEIGALARPDDIRFTDGLPKTRSGKIMRRLLRELASTGEVKGDTTTLEDLNVIAALRAGDEE